MAEKWIQATGVAQHRGALHRALGVAEGEKIPAARLEAARNSKNPHVRHMAAFAHNVKGLGKHTRHLFGKK